MVKIPDLPQRTKHWDRYRQFHWDQHPFVVFESGELAVTDWSPKPSLRRYYSQFRVELNATGDGDSKLFFDKECTQLVPQAWLTQHGHQYYTACHDTGVAVVLGGVSPYIPAWLRTRVGAYYAGGDAPPIGKAFKISKPKVFTKEERARLVSLREQCRMWAAMAGFRKDIFSVRGTDNREVESKQKTITYFLSKFFTDLPQPEVLGVAFYGYIPERETTEVSHLYVKTRQKE